MARYSLAAVFLSALTYSSAHEKGEDWEYLPAKIPTPLSDMGVSTLTVGEGDGAKKRIIITGGCDSEDGNVFVEGGYAVCFSLSQKAYAFDPLRNNEFQAWNGKFQTLADMPRKRARHASAVFNGKVCVYGGRNETDALIGEVDCYDPDADEWNTPFTIPEQYQSSDFAAFATDDGRVYLIGGYTADYIALDRVTIVDITDPSNPTYSDGPKLKEKRGDIDVVLLDGNVYVSGGFTHEDDYAAPKNSVERLDLATNTWKDVGALNKERGDKQLVVLNGKVYALGGEAKVDVTGVPEAELPQLGAKSVVLDSVEVLDPKEDVHGGLAQWRSLAGMPSQLFRFAAAPWEVEGEEEGYIFVFGGQVAYNADCKCFKTTDKVIVFDIAHAEEEEEEVEAKEAKDSGGVVRGGAFASVFAAVAAGLLWLTL